MPITPFHQHRYIPAVVVHGGPDSEEGGAGSPLDILLIERRQLVRSALERMLSGPPLNARVTCSARSDTALELLDKLQIDLVLCQFAAEPVNGLDLAARLSSVGLAPVGLLADDDEEVRVDDVIRAGAGGLFSAQVSDAEFAAGVRAMLRGHFVMSSNLVKERAGLRVREAAVEAYMHLSNAEREILLQLGRAIPIDAIAAGRGTTKKTVRNHVTSVYRKLELRSRADVVLWVARMGLLELQAREPQPLLGDRARI